MHKIGEIIKGSISGIKPYGLFIKLDDDFGFCHISNTSNSFIKDLNKMFYIGQFVTVKVVEITENNEINVSIKDCENDIKNKTSKNNKTFEDMLQKFIKSSDEKISNINKRSQKKQKR